jgi:hypothetical protein
MAGKRKPGVGKTPGSKLRPNPPKQTVFDEILEDLPETPHAIADDSDWWDRREHACDLLRTLVERGLVFEIRDGKLHVGPNAEIRAELEAHMPATRWLIVEIGEGRWPLPAVARLPERPFDLRQNRDDLIQFAAYSGVSILRIGPELHFRGSQEAIDDIDCCISAVPELMVPLLIDAILETLPERVP